ncbi:MAG: hypothetical protein IJP77_06605 [Bacteroidales bacterium]|nr:hypothetical protein [Bacteroidales bacterium]
MTVTVLLSFSLNVKAQDIPEDDEVIVIDVTQNTTETGPQRSISPIRAVYHTVFSFIEIDFLIDMGEVVIRQTNLTSGNSSCTQVSSSIVERMHMPVLFGAGFYCIEFIKEDGSDYIGFFSVE